MALFYRVFKVGREATLMVNDKWWNLCSEWKKKEFSLSFRFSNSGEKKLTNSWNVVHRVSRKQWYDEIVWWAGVCTEQSWNQIQSTTLNETNLHLNDFESLIRKFSSSSSELTHIFQTPTVSLFTFQYMYNLVGDHANYDGSRSADFFFSFIHTCSLTFKRWFVVTN